MTQPPLTRAEILALTGHDLDRAVAERVMGWNVNHVNPDFREGRVHWRDPEHDTLYLPEQASFSTSMEWTWQVVEKLRADGWVVAVWVGKDLCVMRCPKNRSEGAAMGTGEGRHSRRRGLPVRVTCDGGTIDANHAATHRSRRAACLS